MNRNIEVVPCLNTKEYTLTCPYCEEEHEGSCRDARGERFECEYSRRS